MSRKPNHESRITKRTREASTKLQASTRKPAGLSTTSNHEEQARQANTRSKHIPRSRPEKANRKPNHETDQRGKQQAASKHEEQAELNTKSKHEEQKELNTRSKHDKQTRGASTTSKHEEQTHTTKLAREGEQKVETRNWLERQAARCKQARGASRIKHEKQAMCG